MSSLSQTKTISDRGDMSLISEREFSWMSMNKEYLYDSNEIKKEIIKVKYEENKKPINI